MHRHKPYTAIAFGLIFGLFSLWLMFHTFSYDNTNHDMRIAAKAWSDFGAHIPLIRSFSEGPNLSRLVHGQPIQSPLFPKEPIRYHFGFYALVGLLEKLGVRIDLALNIPSAVGLFLMLSGIYLLSNRVFRTPYVAFYSLLFTLCNGSLSFIRFFREHPLTVNTVHDIFTNSRFPAFGPWDGGDITAFWTLNIYTNQRHLALSYGILLIVILLLFSPPNILKKQSLLYAMLIAGFTGSLLFFNYPTAAILGVFCVSFFITQKHTRVPLIIAGLLTLPAIWFLHRVAYIGSNMLWQPGYLVRSVSLPTMFKFWFDNLGLHVVLIPLGLLLAPKSVRKIFLGPLLVLFILPNLLRFSTDMINNHKFFNFFLIIGTMFSAYCIVLLTRVVARSRSYTRVFGYVLICVILFFSTLSGIIDFFPVINDTKGSIPDISKDPDAKYILTHTPPDAVIANSTWFYHPASIAGRTLFSGYTYFTWSYGYDQTTQERTLSSIYEAPDAPSLCLLLLTHHVYGVELNSQPEPYLKPNWKLWNSFRADYENPDTHRRIYITNSLCTNAL